MLPSMRYETKKLSQLYHMRKSFQDHKSSIEKIKKKPIQSAMSRSRDLDQKRNRMHYAFNYTQYVRAKEINKDNLLLYRKCTEDRRSNISMRSDKKRGQFGQTNFTARESRPWIKDSFSRQPEPAPQRQDYLLVNHRSSPITKLTNYERSKQNLRLAIKIAKPCASINTKKLEQIHEAAKAHRQRIMRYDSISLKSAKYLDKKLSNSSFRSHRMSSLEGAPSHKSSKASNRKSPENPQSPPKPKPQTQKPQQKYRISNNKKPIFRNKHNDNQYAFSLTDYQS